MSNDERMSDDVEAPLLQRIMQVNLEVALAALIGKACLILAVQILITVAVAAAVVANHPVAIFFTTSWGGWILFIFIILIALTVKLLLVIFLQKRPINFLLLAILAVCFGLVIGVVASFISAMKILEAAIATVVVAATLMAYTIWGVRATRRGESVASLTYYLLTLVIMLALFIAYQNLFPTAKFTEALLNVVYVLILSYYVLYNTFSVIVVVFIFGLPSTLPSSTIP